MRSRTCRGRKADAGTTSNAVLAGPKLSGQALPTLREARGIASWWNEARLRERGACSLQRNRNGIPKASAGGVPRDRRSFGFARDRTGTERASAPNEPEADGRLRPGESRTGTRSLRRERIGRREKALRRRNGPRKAEREAASVAERTADRDGKGFGPGRTGGGRQASAWRKPDRDAIASARADREAREGASAPERTSKGGEGGSFGCRTNRRPDREGSPDRDGGRGRSLLLSQPTMETGEGFGLRADPPGSRTSFGSTSTGPSGRAAQPHDLGMGDGASASACVRDPEGTAGASAPTEPGGGIRLRPVRASKNQGKARRSRPT